MRYEERRITLTRRAVEVAGFSSLENSQKGKDNIHNSCFGIVAHFDRERGPSTEALDAGSPKSNKKKR